MNPKTGNRLDWTDYTAVGEYHVPATLRNGLELWAAEHIMPGDFLRSVLENNLSEAVVRADRVNRYCLFGIVNFIHNRMPPDCHGSKSKVKNWAAYRKYNQKTPQRV